MCPGFRYKSWYVDVDVEVDETDADADADARGFAASL
jgi:hypothetical protein